MMIRISYLLQIASMACFVLSVFVGAMAWARGEMASLFVIILCAITLMVLYIWQGIIRENLRRQFGS